MRVDELEQRLKTIEELLLQLSKINQLQLQQKVEPTKITKDTKFTLAEFSVLYELFISKVKK